MGSALEILHIIAAFFAAIGAVDFFYEMFRLVYRLARRRKKMHCRKTPDAAPESSEASLDPPASPDGF